MTLVILHSDGQATAIAHGNRLSAIRTLYSSTLGERFSIGQKSISSEGKASQNFNSKNEQSATPQFARPVRLVLLFPDPHKALG
jgi:hypothetical protein